MSLEIHTFTSGPLQTHAHLVWDPVTRAAWIVDAPHGCSPAILQWLQKQRASAAALILTHSHWDHFGDAAALQEALHVPVWAHAADHPNLEQPGLDGVPRLLQQRPVHPSRALQEGDVLHLGESRWVVLHTPGHTPGGICLWEPQESLLLTGDTLFDQGVGRTDLTTGNGPLMQTSVQRLLSLPPETLFFPGHGPSSTIGAQLGH